MQFPKISRVIPLAALLCVIAGAAAGEPAATTGSPTCTAT
jgi:hypothetical protein